MRIRLQIFSFTEILEAHNKKGDHDIVKVKSSPHIEKQLK